MWFETRLSVQYDNGIIIVIFLFIICLFIVIFQELNNVGVINAESEKELKLETVKTFGWSNVLLLGGDGTNYTCKYTDNYKWIINVRTKQSFTMDGGILKFGSLDLNSSSTSYRFIIVNGANSYVNIRYVNLIFINKMNSLIYIEGGTILIV
jgi:hypothetical protein